MKPSNRSFRLAVASLLTATAVAGSLFSLPILGSKISPVQHMVNILAGILLGPGYALLTAFSASLIRNLLGLGTLLSFPGSMVGALLAAQAYAASHRLLPTLAGEVIGTGLLGGLLSYPVAVFLMGLPLETISFYAFIIPFLVSSVMGSLMAGFLTLLLERHNLFRTMQHKLSSFPPSLR